MFILALAAAATGSATPVDRDNAVRCVRQEVTGSLSSARKVCHTVSEWRRINRDSNEEARRVIGPEGRSGSGQ